MRTVALSLHTCSSHLYPQRDAFGRSGLDSTRLPPHTATDLGNFWLKLKLWWRGSFFATSSACAKTLLRHMTLAWSAILTLLKILVREAWRAEWGPAAVFLSGVPVGSLARGCGVDAGLCTFLACSHLDTCSTRAAELRRSGQQSRTYGSWKLRASRLRNCFAICSRRQLRHTRRTRPLCGPNRTRHSDRP